MFVSVRFVRIVRFEVCYDYNRVIVGEERENGPKRVCKEGPVFEASEVEF